MTIKSLSLIIIKPVPPICIKQQGHFSRLYLLHGSFVSTWKGQTGFIDLCAGIGVLSIAALQRDPQRELVCIDINPEYVKAGKKISARSNVAMHGCHGSRGLPTTGRI